MIRATRPLRILATLLLATLSVADRAMPSDSTKGALADQAAASTRSLDRTELEFLVTERSFAHAASNRIGYSQCTARRYAFQGQA